MTDSARDELTGLLRRGVLEDLNGEFVAREPSDVWSLMVIDLDHFKLINDLCGHLEGDRVLKSVADVISSCVRSSDIPVRYGGDEFVVVMPSTVQLNAVNQAERILEYLDKAPFVSGMDVSLSIGVAESREADARLSEVFDRADRALFNAKKGGRGRVSFVSESEAESEGKEISFDHFLNRHGELDTLRSRLDFSIQNGSRLVVITGDSGVGKTRLVHELKHYCSFRDALFLEHGCSELGSEMPFIQMALPVADAVSSLAPGASEELAGKVGPVLPHTAQALPGLGLRETEDALSEENGVVRFRMHSEIAAVLKWLSSRAPVVYFIDSLQWISAQDLDLLAYLVRTAGDSPILFIAAARTPLENCPEVNRVLRVLSSIVASTEINLGPLSDEYIAHMVMFALKDPQVPASVLEKLKERSDGNPLFLRELLLSMVEKGFISWETPGKWVYMLPENVELPDSIVKILESRLEKVSRGDRKLLEAASLFPGGSFRIDVLAEVLGIDELNAATSLEYLVSSGLLAESLSADGIPCYSFVPDPFRSFLHDQMARGTRMALQSRLGVYWERRFLAGEENYLSLAAHHYCRGLKVAKAREYALLAGRRANDRDSRKEALKWYEKYLSFAASPGEDRETGLRARVEAGLLYTLAARYPEAERLLQEAGGLSHGGEEEGLVSHAMALLHFNRGDFEGAKTYFASARELLPTGEKRISSEIRRGFMHHMLGSTDLALEILQRSLEEIEAISDDVLRARLLANYYRRHGFILLSTADGAGRGADECRKAVEICRELGDRTGEAKALLATASSLSATSFYASRIRILEEAIEVLTETGDMQSMMVALVNLGQAYDNAGEGRTAREYFDRCLKLVEATGTKRFGVWAHCHLGILDLKEGSLQSSEEHLRYAAELGDELGLGRMSVVSKVNLVLALAERGRFQEAEEMLNALENNETALGMGDRIMKTIYAARARILIRGYGNHGDPSCLDEACRLLERAIELSGSSPSLDLAEFLAELSGCLEKKGQPEEALKKARMAVKALEGHISSIDSREFRKNITGSPAAAEIYGLLGRLQQRPGSVAGESVPAD